MSRCWRAPSRRRFDGVARARTAADEQRRLRGLPAGPVTFRSWREFEGWDGAAAAVKRFIKATGARRVLEIGSGAAPTLSLSTARELGLEYTTNDVAAEEVAKAPSGYSTLLLDISRDDVPKELVGSFDFVFSRMVNEHVQDGERYYRSIAQLLCSGGTTAHWFSTLYSLPFLVNRLAPERVAARLFQAAVPRGARRHERFKAYYSWSRGPSRSAMRRFHRLGFHVEAFTGYFGHGYYAPRVALLDRLEQRKADALVSHPIVALCTYGHVVMTRI